MDLEQEQIYSTESGLRKRFDNLILRHA